MFSAGVCPPSPTPRGGEVNQPGRRVISAAFLHAIGHGLGEVLGCLWVGSLGQRGVQVCQQLNSFSTAGSCSQTDTCCHLLSKVLLSSRTPLPFPQSRTLAGVECIQPALQRPHGQQGCSVVDEEKEKKRVFHFSFCGEWAAMPKHACF